MSESLPALPSILTVPAAQSVDDLLNRDPLLLTDEELDTLIKHFRDQRVTFLEAEKTAKAAGKRVVAPKSDSAKAAANLSLEDLLK